MSEMTEQQKELLAKVRAATLGAPVVKTGSIVRLNGVELEVRRPSLADNRAIEEGSIVGVGRKAKVDGTRKAALVLLHCVYLPGTDIKPYSRHDIEAIEERSEDDFVGPLLEAFAELADKKKEPEAIEKNSDGAQTDKP